MFFFAGMRFNAITPLSRPVSFLCRVWHKWQQGYRISSLPWRSGRGCKGKAQSKEETQNPHCHLCHTLFLCSEGVGQAAAEYELQ